jgi:hypothetical protein
MSVGLYTQFIFFPSFFLSFFSFHRTAEFILYKLQEMGKISKDDISLVKEAFAHCDVDQSEALTALT